ncbi:hypothetical protein MNV49_001955 [Pseudohyphozyma bogoriensis]|nr:hypothetical protein MNV49_001955 [Pseudohyphozyma bogoriensis]
MWSSKLVALFGVLATLETVNAARVHRQPRRLAHRAASASSCAALYYQCGGTNFTGPTCCESGATCVVQNPYYSQCVASSTSSTSAAAASSSTASASVTGSVLLTTDCAAVYGASGSSCTFQNDYYSQCLPSSAVSSSSSSSTTSAKTGLTSGDGTAYGTSDAGAACLLPTRTDQRFAAFSGAVWDNSEWCGGCVRVTGPVGSIDVQVTNECPECAEGSLDLSDDAYETITGTSPGRTSITWDWISCVDAGLTTGDVEIAWKSGSSAYWAAIQPRGGAVGISAVSIKESSASSYTSLARQNYNYWLAESGAGAGPFSVLVDWQDGTSSTYTNIVLNAIVGDA